MASPVATGDRAWSLLQKAVAEKAAIPAFPCSSSKDCVAALEESAKTGKPVAVHFSSAGSKHFAGPTLENGAHQASQLGAVVGAHLVRYLAPAYGATVLCHTTCSKEDAAWLEDLLEVDEEFKKTNGEPLFSSHGVDLPGGAVAKYSKCFEKMKSLGIPLEVNVPSAADLAALKPFTERLLTAKGELQAYNARTIKVAVFSCKQYDQDWLEKANKAAGSMVELVCFDVQLSAKTVQLATGCFAVCVFVNDDVTAEVVTALAALGVKLIALRCAGFNNVDLFQAADDGVTIARVPAYSPDAVAEHAVSLILSANRKIPQAWKKTRSGNFCLDGQLGFDMIGKKVGVVGTGQIGYIAARILKRGFNCDVVAYDVYKNPKIMNPEPEGLGIQYLELDELFRTCDIITLHAPLMPATRHMVNMEAIKKMKPGVVIVNCARGALIDTKALLYGLKTKIVGAAGLDVYEEETAYFFEDFSHDVIEDDVFARLLSFPNVTVTAHQAFFTSEALQEISNTTLANIIGFSKDGAPPKQRGTLDTVCLPPPGRTRSKQTFHPTQLVGGAMEIDYNPGSDGAVQGRGKGAAAAEGAGGKIKVAVFSCKSYDKESLLSMRKTMGADIDFVCHDVQLNADTAPLAAGCFAVCIFVNDNADTAAVVALAAAGVKMIALRCAGFNNCDFAKAAELGIEVARVPAYSPHAVAEHAITLMTALNRKLPQAWQKTRTGNFNLIGQLGFDMKGKKVGVLGTGQIGYIAAHILKRGFECDVVAYDVFKNPKIMNPEPEGLGIPYAELDEIYRTCDVITIHAPLMPATHHMINKEAIDKMKPGVMIINCSRGGLIDTKALLDGLKSKKVGAAGVDVYEEEDRYFFEDFTNDFVDDDVFARLLSFPNVMVTAHQAFFTQEAMQEIAKTTINNIVGVFETGASPKQKGTLETSVKPKA